MCHLQRQADTKSVINRWTDKQMLYKERPQRSNPMCQLAYANNTKKKIVKIKTAQDFAFNVIWPQTQSCNHSAANRQTQINVCRGKPASESLKKMQFCSPIHLFIAAVFNTACSGSEYIHKDFGMLTSENGRASATYLEVCKGQPCNLSHKHTSP